jgi:hypothetical protein
VTQNRVPRRIKWQNKLLGYIYSILTYVAIAGLIVSTIHILFVYVNALYFGKVFDVELVKLSVYIITGTFLFVFVYDERCRIRLYG